MTALASIQWYMCDNSGNSKRMAVHLWTGIALWHNNLLCLTSSYLLLRYKLRPNTFNYQSLIVVPCKHSPEVICDRNEVKIIQSPLSGRLYLILVIRTTQCPTDIGTEDPMCQYQQCQNNWITLGSFISYYKLAHKILPLPMNIRIYWLAELMIVSFLNTITYNTLH